MSAWTAPTGQSSKMGSLKVFTRKARAGPSSRDGGGGAACLCRVNLCGMHEGNMCQGLDKAANEVPQERLAMYAMHQPLLLRDNRSQAPRKHGNESGGLVDVHVCCTVYQDPHMPHLVAKCPKPIQQALAPN